MILKKRLQDGKTIYEPISFEEAVEQRAEKSDFVFTDEDEKDKFEDAGHAVKWGLERLTK